MTKTIFITGNRLSKTTSKGKRIMLVSGYCIVFHPENTPNHQHALLSFEDKELPQVAKEADKIFYCSDLDDNFGGYSWLKEYTTTTTTTTKG